MPFENGGVHQLMHPVTSLHDRPSIAQGGANGPGASSYIVAFTIQSGSPRFSRAHFLQLIEQQLNL